MSSNKLQAAADLVLRELSDIESRDVFGGQWVKVGPVMPYPPPPPPEEER